MRAIAAAAGANSADLPVITTLRADIVPLREFAIRRWYAANRLWYYHRRSLPGEMNTSRKFYNLVDPDLRELCRILHEAQIHTTPSCQGHFRKADHFRNIWNELERATNLIQGDGLRVVDSETGRAFRFRAATFMLPWSNFEDFFGQASVHQAQGYLGMLLPRYRHDVVCMLHNQPFRTERARICFDGPLSCVLGGSLFGIHVTPRNAVDCSQLWREVTRYVKATLEKAIKPGSSRSLVQLSRLTDGGRRPSNRVA